MKNALAFKELVKIFQSGDPRENFGPGSDHFYLAFDLTASVSTFAKQLKDLPCPVIGIGQGALEQACDVVLENKEDLTQIASNISKAPMTSMVLVQLLRMSEKLSQKDALTAESFAYATVQTGPEFKAWLENYDAANKSLPANPSPVTVSVSQGTLSIVMNAEDSQNQIDVTMRDALCEALTMSQLDPDIKKISLTGRGRIFSTGGAVGEFGSVPDPATAHWIRTQRLPAWHLARLDCPLNIHVNGAAIGAGTEIAGFGTHVTSSPKAWFQLPELKYGLIPGAGGTVSLPRRMGRQRTAYLALSMKRVSAQTALDWGLIDDIVE